MIETVEAADSGYRFVPGVSQYSCGVAALAGFTLERVRFTRPVSLKAGFARIARILKDAGRPITAFAACELRSPAPFTEEGFREFNQIYAQTLIEWGVMKDGINPIARSNVCPKVGPPPEPSFYAFSYAIPAHDAPPSFVISGSGETVEGKPNYRDYIVRPGDVTPAAMLEKAKWVLDEQERRMNALDGDWSQTTAVQLYTIQDVHSYLESEIGRRNALRSGLTWHYARPPIEGLDYEMDCRCVHSEKIIN